MKGKYIVIMLNFFCSLFCMAQESYTIPTPTAYNIIKHGEVPVDYYTGKYSLSIPLFALNLRGIDLNVSLSHDMTGVKVNELPTWTGYNWSLMAGGVIVRSPQGKVYPLKKASKYSTDLLAFDEYTQRDFTYGKTYYGNYVSEPNRLSRWLQPNSYIGDSIFHSDSSPDIFYFNFMGISGTFFMGNDGNWKVQSEHNLKVIKEDDCLISPFIKYYHGGSSGITPSISSKYSHVEMQKSYKGFTIVDENGTRYVFGGTKEGETDAIEYTIPFFNATAYNKEMPWMSTAWYLSKVIDRYGVEVYSFEYERGLFLVNANYSINANLSLDKFENNVVDISPLMFLAPLYSKYKWSNFSRILSSGTQYNLSSPTYLKRIKCNNGLSLLFEKDRDKILSGKDFYPNISSYDVDYNTSDLLEKFFPLDNSITWYVSNFKNPWEACYVYLSNELYSKYQNPGNKDNRVDFLSSTGLSPLRKILLIDANDNVRDSVSLIYNYDSRIHLTSVNTSEGSYELDYNDYGLLPKDCMTNRRDHWGLYNGYNKYVNYDGMSYFDNVSDLHNPDVNYAKIGLLKSITYPTGGKTCFEYVMNHFTSARDYLSNNMIAIEGYGGGFAVKSITNYSDKKKSKILSKVDYDYEGGQLFSFPIYVSGGSSSFSTSDMKLSITGITWASAKSSYDYLIFSDKPVIPLSGMMSPVIGYSKVTEKVSNEHKTIYKYNNYSDVPDLFYVAYTGLQSPNDKYSERGFMRGKVQSKVVLDSNDDTVSSTKYTYRNDIAKMNKYSVLSSDVRFVNCNNSIILEGGIRNLYYGKYDVVNVEVKEKRGEQNFCYKSMFDNQDFLSDSFYVRKCVSMEIHQGDMKKKTKYEYPLNNETVSKNKDLVNMFFFPVLAEKIYLNDIFQNAKKYIYNYKQRVIDPRCSHHWREKPNMVLDSVQIFVGSEIYPKMTQTISYNTEVMPYTIINSDGSIVHLEYDKYDNVLSKTFINEDVPRYLYDSEGLMKSAETYKYNSLNQMTERTNPFGYVECYEYDEKNRLENVKDSNGRCFKSYSYWLKNEGFATDKMIEYVGKVDALLSPYIKFYDARRGNTEKRDEWNAMTPVEKYTAIENDYHDEIIFCDGAPVQYQLYSTLHPVWWKRKTNKGNYVIGWAEKDCILHGELKPAKELEGRGFLLINKDRRVINGYISNNILRDETYAGFSYADLLQRGESIPDTASYSHFDSLDVTVGGTLSEVNKMRKDAWDIVMLNDEYYPYFKDVETCDNEIIQQEDVKKENRVKQIGVNQYSVTFGDSYSDVIIEVYDAEGYLVGGVEKDKVKCGDVLVVETDEWDASELTVFSGEDIVLQVKL